MSEHHTKENYGGHGGGHHGHGGHHGGIGPYGGSWGGWTWGYPYYSYPYSYPYRDVVVVEKEKTPDYTASAPVVAPPTAPKEKSHAMMIYGFLAVLLIIIVLLLALKK